MAMSIDDIAKAVMNTLYTVVKGTTGDPEKDNKEDPFVCWCKPGIPFDPDDFRFAKYMMVGQGASGDDQANDAALQFTQAAGFSRFVDFVPSVDGVIGGKVEDGVLRPSSATLSEFYKRILEASQVAQIAEPAGIDEKIKQLRDQLKPMQEGYDDYANRYDEAKRAYVQARVNAARSATDQLDFQAIGPGLRNKMIRASEAWETDGFKTQYENLQAEVLSLRSKRSPALWRTEALNNYNSLPEGQNATFGEARITMPYPGSFAASNSGWTQFDLKSEHVDKMSSMKSTKWQAGGGVGWGSFKIGASGSGSTTQTLSISNTSGFTLKMGIAQVVLMRQTWFDPWFLRSEFWRFNPASIEGQRGDIVSDGGLPPKGLVVAWPVSAIFVRDVEITMEELKDEQSELVKTLKAEASGGWGLGAINLGGSYERNSQEKKQITDVSNGKLTVSGLQLVGFLCELMGQAPNPKAGLTWVSGG
jgi:hypothetical protein